MKVQHLPHGLASLVHHVELSKAGWRDRALELIAVCVVHENGGVCPRGDFPALLSARLPGGLDRGQADDLVSRLGRTGRIFQLGNLLKLSEAAVAEFLRLTEDHRQLETKVQEQFSQFLEPVPAAARPNWETFEKRFLTPLILELGARTYEFLAGQPAALPSSDSFLGFLTSVPEEHRASITQAIERFFSPKDPDIRAYLLRLLNAVFLVQATGIPGSTLASFADRIKQKLRLRVLVDTNFLFSLLGLHENPADDVVEVLNRLITQLHERLDVRLYMIPSTFDEAKRTIAAYAARLSGLNIDRNLAEAVRRGTSDLSGITLKFIKEAVTAGKGLSAQEYFQPYLDNLLTIARSKGVELYNEQDDHLRLDQAVIDDVLAQLQFEKQTKGEQRAKSYELVVHDMVLWHFVRRKRPARLDSHLDAEFWVATIDFGLLGFDRYKMRKHNLSVAVCIHPTVLLQILQLWVPRSDLLDAALVDSLRPLLPHVFDREAEQVTIRILRALSRFEDIGDLSQETLTHVLFDKAIRARVAGTEKIEEQIELVREALVAETKRLELRTKHLELEAAGLRDEVQRRDEEMEALKGQLAGLEQLHESRSRKLEEQLSGERAKRDALGDELAAVKADLQARQTRRKAWFGLAGAAVASAALFYGAAYVGMYYGALPSAYPMWVTQGAVWILATGASLLAIESSASRRPILANHRVVAWLVLTRRYCWSVIATVVLSLLGSAIWEAVRGGIAK